MKHVPAVVGDAAGVRLKVLLGVGTIAPGESPMPRSDGGHEGSGKVGEKAMTESMSPRRMAAPAAMAAVTWAADDAARRGLPLRIIHVVERWPARHRRVSSVWLGPTSWRASASRCSPRRPEQPRARQPDAAR